MVNIFFFPTIILVLYVKIQLPIVFGTKISKPIGFSTDLIHRDSIESPWYDSSVNQSDLVERALHRSSSRLSHLKSLLKLSINGSKEVYSIDSTIVGVRGEYLMEILIGTPPVRQWAGIDTASHIVWTQCLKCVKCYQQNQPKFNPNKSSSYRPIGCGSKTCIELGYDKNCINGNCKYRLQYLDKSISFGELASETFKLGNIYFPRMMYGCSNYNVGLFEKTSAGIIGLGNGPHSLISRLPPSIGGKFSYCLTALSKGNVRSKINFGANAIVPSRGSISTPLVLKVPRDFYYITLEAISIQNMRFSFMFGADKGNTIIDTGTNLSYLQNDLYQQLKNVITREIQDKPIPQPRDSELKLCYKNSKNFKIPTIIYHFSRGADLALPMKNTIIETRGQYCLAIVPTNDTVGIIGFISQTDQLIGYDIERLRVSFLPNYC